MDHGGSASTVGRMRQMRWVVAVTSLVLGAVAVSQASPVRAATVPAGFTDTAIASFSRPTAVEWLPDGRIAVLEQGGRLRTATPSRPFTTALQVPDLCSNGERGLLGLAPDPAQWSNGHVYLYTTRSSTGTCANRVSRFTMRDGVIDPASEVVLIDRISSLNGNHNGGDLDLGSDGYLYVAVGDAGRDPRGDSGSGGDNDAAQDLSLLNGKILRLTLDGRPAPGNPLSGPGSVRCGSRGNTAATPRTSCQEIFAWGLRNPYRFAFDGNTGRDRFFVNDVGQRTFEEVNDGAIGRNYGWPMREGPCPQGRTPPCPGPGGGLTDPVTAYGRATGSFVTAGAFVPDGRWPSSFDGGYLFADGGSGNIWLRRRDGTVDYRRPFATGAFGITDMAFGYDDGGRTVLYYVSVGGGLRMIRPVTAPVAAPPEDAVLLPVTPFRAYDTARTGATDAIGTDPGFVVAASSRRIELDPPAGVTGALVNITVASAAGPGFVTTWSTGDRPDTSTLNVDRRAGVVANATIVPLAPDGSFLLDAALTGRVVVDVFAWIAESGGSPRRGRFIASDPARLVDTRRPAGTTLASGSSNPYRVDGTGATRDITIEVAGASAVPDDGSAAAAVISIAAISRSSERGYLGAYPSGVPYTGTSNVNVLAGEIRANLVVVPLGRDGDIVLRTFNVADVAVDVLGYVTSRGATPGTDGLYTGADTFRLVDTREPGGRIGRLPAGGSTTLDVPGGRGASAVVHNLTAVRTSAWGFLSVHPGPRVPEVSSVNFTGPGQTRAALAFSTLAGDGSVRVTTSAATDVLVDVLGTFSR